MATTKQDGPGQNKTAEMRCRDQQTSAASPRTSADGKTAPGLDPDRQAAMQRAAQQADTLRDGYFAALMAMALHSDSVFGAGAYKVYVERLLEEAGNPRDPIERMMIQQLGLAHFKIAQLHASAGEVEEIEAIKMYNSVAARLLGEFRRTALALRAYQAHSPKGKAENKAAIFKLAQ